MKKREALSILLLLAPLSLFIGCGYKPSTYYTKPLLGDKISTNVTIDIKNPTDSVFLKDALNEAVLGVFNAKVDLKSDTKILLKVNKAEIITLDYDENGYPILYRAKTSITAYITDKNNNFNNYSAIGYYDFSLQKNSVLSDDLKHNAIKEAFSQALQKIEFKLAERGINDH